MRKLFVLALFFTALLFGCVQQQEESKFTELNASVRVLQAKCDALEAEKQGLQSSLSAANSGKQACDAELAKAKAEAAKFTKLGEAEQALSGAKLSDAGKNALKNYKEFDSLACGYYFGFSGFFTSSNVTIPLGCILLANAYINASKTYLDESNALQANAEKALGVIREIKG